MARGVVVCYWGPGHKRSGHIGMAVEADAGSTYITWVPSGASGDPGGPQALQSDFRVMTGIRNDVRNNQLALGMGQLRPNQERTNRLSNTLTKTPTQVSVGSQTHRFNYGQIFKNPDLTCEIPAIDLAGGTSLGLDVDRIYHWWVSYAMAAGSMNSISNTIPWKRVSTSRNCCSTVYRALTMGGASYYRSKFWKKVYLTPPEVWEYATKLKARIDELNQHNAAVAASAAELGQKLKGLTVGGPNVELPTVQQWLAMSKVDVGVFKWKAARKEQIAIIDQELEKYWSQGPWPADGDYDDDAVAIRDAKSHALCFIIGQSATHAALKPKSDRKHAVAAMLTRAWHVMKQRVRGNQDLRQWGDGAITSMVDRYGSAFDAYGGGLAADTFTVA